MVVSKSTQPNCTIACEPRIAMPIDNIQARNRTRDPILIQSLIDPMMQKWVLLATAPKMRAPKNRVAPLYELLTILPSFSLSESESESESKSASTDKRGG